ncbi:hypothetical protein B9Z55_003375 [Caenorhabditis nigoni]|nr:hypothetical protein B9Z55_003375 [Caenorhabditis nigoni]
MRMFPLYDIPYPVYATTTKVSGSGTKTFPDFHPSTSGHYWVSITFQDHFPDDSFQKITLRWANSQDSGDIFSNSGQTSVYGNYKAAESYWYHLDYNMTLDYYYLSQDVQNLQIRFYTSNPPSNWLPYSD